MQALMLLDENHPSTHTQESGKQDESNNESEYDIANEKTQKAPSYSTCGPTDVSSLQAHEFKGLLKPLENWIILESFLVYVTHIQGLETKEQRQTLSCCDEEDTSTYNHHDALLENLLPNCKVLNINTPKKQKVPKETNWKQKFQKPQNENICLTYLNMEMNGNFHFLSFCAAFLKVQNQVL